MKGKLCVRWKGRSGSWVVAAICPSNPKRCLVPCGKYRISYTSHDGRPESEPGYTDRDASEHLARSRHTTAARIHSGQLPPESAGPRLTISELLAKWHRYVAANGATPAGARRQFQRATDVAHGIGAVRVSDLTPGVVMEWVDGRRRANQHKRNAFSASTAANYLASAKSFTRWCAVVARCAPTDYLSGVKVRRTGEEPRRRRRALSEAELSKLLEFTRKNAAAHYGLTGPERHALYLLATSTGLRAAELSTLARANFDLARREVTVSQGKTKNRREAVLPVPAPVLAVVRRLFDGGNLIWPNRGAASAAWWANGARMVAADLRAAKIPVVVDGAVYDFHSLRGQFATDLDRAGVSLTRAQKLMRHSTPVLTAKHYVRADAAELAREVAKLKRGRRS